MLALLILTSLHLSLTHPTTAAYTHLAPATSWTLLNLTHTPPSTTAPHIHNGSIGFILTVGDSAATFYTTHACACTLAVPAAPSAAAAAAAAGGPYACSDAWPDFLYYWRAKDADQAAGVVELDVWFAYLDCSGPPGGVVSESGSLTLPPASRAGEEDGSRVWDVVDVPVQTASLTAFRPGQYEEVCL